VVLVSAFCILTSALPRLPCLIFSHQSVMTLSLKTEPPLPIPPAEPMPAPINDPPAPLENPDAPVREPDPQELQFI
jgi:hypothetical protein